MMWVCTSIGNLGHSLNQDDAIMEAKARIRHFIRQVYIQKRPHSALGDLTPVVGILRGKKMQNLWDQKVEQSFFQKAMRDFASPEQLFYLTDDNRFLAYWPKNYKGKKSTLQSRNSLIGNFTETWINQLIQNCVKAQGLFAVQGAVCEEIELTEKSPADVVIARKKRTHLNPEDILVIFEVKMSVVWNWELKDDELLCLGDYKTHQGIPGLLRSDSMLKAIGKAINIRVSSHRASAIPIIIIGNTPITNSYLNKVDHLKAAGIAQGFWSVNPKPLDKQKTLEITNGKGFMRFDTYESFQHSVIELLSMPMNFFSSMKSKEELGRLIESANNASTYQQKAERFLKLLQDGTYE